MSLIAWYPFNGDVKNHGVGDMELTQTTAPTFTNNGKIGKALNTGGFKWTAAQTEKILNNNELSICFWIYVLGETDSKTQLATIFGNDSLGNTTNNRKFSLFQYPTCNDLNYYWQNNVSNQAFLTGTVTGVLPSKKWTHVAITYKNPEMNIYINGELVKTRTGISESTNFAYDTQVIYNSAYHYINDMRFYDHCLSVQEIKEINKCLILHLPMNKYSCGNKNLAIPGQLINYNATSINYDKTTDTYTIVSPVGTNSWGYGVKIGTTNKCIVPYGASYRFSFDVMIPVQHSMTIDINNYSNDSNVANWNGNDNDLFSARTSASATIKQANTWTHVSFGSKNAHEGNTNKVAIYDSSIIYLYTANDTGPVTWYIKNFRFELGAGAAPYGTDSTENIEYDTSGFGNNGIKEESSVYSTDTVVYDSSMVFGRDEQRIMFENGIPFEESNFSFSIWAKAKSYLASAKMLTICNSNQTQAFNLGPTSSSTPSMQFMSFYETKAFVNTYLFEYPLNEWVHWAGTCDGTKQILYKNGEKCLELKLDTYSSTLTGIAAIGGGNQNLGRFFDGQLSDLRIYNSVLSADDIKDLYQIKAKADKNGNLYSNFFIEDNTLNTAKIDKKYNISSNEFNTITSTYDMPIKFFTDNSIWARIFYHNCKGGTILFSNVAEVKNTNTENKYSRLYLLDNDLFKGIDNKFEFMLTYPTDSTKYNRWKQTNSPCNEFVTNGDGSAFAEGYEAIHIDSSSNYWGGLTRQNSSTTSVSSCYISGSVGHNNWFYAIGAASKHNQGIPSSATLSSDGDTANDVELWVRIDNLKNKNFKTEIGKTYINSNNIYEI